MSRPTWARWVTRVSLGLAVVALILTVRDTGLVAIGTYFKRIGWGWFAVVIMEAAITTMDAIAIRAFLSPDNDKVRLRSTLLSQLAGRAVNAVTPSGNLGEAVKVSVLVDHVSQSRAVATILLYNVVSFSVELVTVGIGTPLMAVFLPLPMRWRVVLLVVGAVVLVIAFGLYHLVRRGVLVSVAKLAARVQIRGLATVRRWIWKVEQPSRQLLNPERYARWEPKLRGIDDKMKLVEGARVRDRRIGILMVALSRLTSMSLSFLLLIAMGERLTIGLVAAITVGGFFIYIAGAVVPRGVGVNEGGYNMLFRALGENPARGTVLILARRVALIAYAAIGLVLVTASETVKRARERQHEKAASGPLPVHPEVRTAEPRVVTVVTVAAPAPVPATVTKAGASGD